MERNGNRNAVACPDGVCRRSGLRVGVAGCVHKNAPASFAPAQIDSQVLWIIRYKAYSDLSCKSAHFVKIGSAI